MPPLSVTPGCFLGRPSPPPDRCPSSHSELRCGLIIRTGRSSPAPCSSCHSPLLASPRHLFQPLLSRRWRSRPLPFLHLHPVTLILFRSCCSVLLGSVLDRRCVIDNRETPPHYTASATVNINSNEEVWCINSTGFLGLRYCLFKHTTCLKYI